MMFYQYVYMKARNILLTREKETTKKRAVAGKKRRARVSQKRGKKTRGTAKKKNVQKTQFTEQRHWRNVFILMLGATAVHSWVHMLSVPPSLLSPEWHQNKAAPSKQHNKQPAAPCEQQQSGRRPTHLLLLRLPLPLQELPPLLLQQLLLERLLSRRLLGLPLLWKKNTNRENGDTAQKTQATGCRSLKPT